MFILQNFTENAVEKAIINDNFSKYEIPYCYVSENLISALSTRYDIPIGDISFVERFLNIHYGIEHLTPTDIPEYLKTEEFLKREYNIVSFDNIPQDKIVFVKDMSKVKGFTGILNFKQNKNLLNSMRPEHKYQVSSLLYIEAEYRVYVIDHNIVAISHYDGNVLVQPDINFIRKAVMLIYANERHLKSYTMDIAVGKFGSAIIEVQNWISVGLYSTNFGRALNTAYIDGIDYELYLHGCKIPQKFERYYYSNF